jgi:tRNA pseudouridine55 synthase
MKDSSIGKMILVNKPAGMSSFAVVSRIKKLFPGKKVGHAGALDPLAEGLLLVLVGKATKKQEKFMKLKKEYEVELLFGLESDTYDLEGKVRLGKYSQLLKKLSRLNQEELEKVLGEYQGEIVQTVPIFSAVKIKGKPLYKLARRGVKLKNLPRKKVIVYQAEVVGFSPLRKKLMESQISVEKALKVFPSARLKLLVSKGFYVRSLAHDLGERLAVGALVKYLLRTKIGPYSLEEAISLEELLANGGRFRP